MPPWQRSVNKFLAAGMHTASPGDFKPDSKRYNALINVRVREGGAIGPRPGLRPFNASAGLPVADIDKIVKFGDFGSGQILVVQAGGQVGTVGESVSWSSKLTGFASGVAASIVLWRPENQGQQWAYCFSAGTHGKFDRGSAVQQIGIAPPGKSAGSQYTTTPAAAPTVAAGGGSPGPTGTYQYAYRYRDPTTGVRSELSNLSLEITVTNEDVDLSSIAASADAIAGTLIDIFRIGGTLADFTLVASINDGTTTYTDAFTDAQISGNETLGTTVRHRPFVVVNASGVETAGVPLPFVWGPYEGHMLGTGYSQAPGTLYWTNGNDPDSMDPANYLEVTGVNEPLIRGFNYDQRSFVASNSGLYVITPSVSGLTRFTATKTACSRGPISADAITVGDQIYFVSHDGVFATRGGAEVPLSGDIYNMFPHEGATGEPPSALETMSLPNFVEGGFVPGECTLHYHSGFLRFSFRNKAGNTSILTYDFAIGGWIFDDYQGLNIRTIYGVEGQRAATGLYSGAQEVLLGTASGLILKQQAGVDDNGNPIACGLVTDYDDFGDPRAKKRLGDMELDFDPKGVQITATVRLDNGTAAITPVNLPTTTGRQTKVLDINSGHGRLAKNVALALAWTATGTTNPQLRLYSWAPSWTPKPEDTLNRALEWHPVSDKVADGYVYGIELHIDTAGQDVDFQVWADNANTSVSFTANSGTSNQGDSTSEQKLRFTWVGNSFYAKMLKLLPAANANLIRIFDWKWLAYEDAPILDDIDTNWVKPLGDCDTAYVTGVRFEVDTENLAKTVVIQTRHAGVTTTHTPREGTTLTANGRHTVYKTFEPVRADLVRAYTTGGNDIRLFGVCWYAHPEPPRLGNWDETFKDFGKPMALKGVEFFVDTLGQDKTVQVQLDGAVHESITVNANGRKSVTIPFTVDGNGEYPRAVTARLFPTDVGPAYLYRYRWIYEESPEQVSNFNPIWTDSGYQGAKFLQGARVTHDTKGATKSVQVDLDGGSTLGPFSLSSTIRDTSIITFDPPVITHSMRLRATDANAGFLYGVEWIWEPAPDLATLWETPPTTHGANEWMHIRRGWIAVSDGTATITLRIILDGVNYDISIAAPGAGTYTKIHWEIPANKFRSVKYRVSSAAAFRLYKNDCAVLVKPWGSQGGYETVKPFGDDSWVSGARI